MDKIYGVHWTTGFGTPEVTLCATLGNAKILRQTALDRGLDRFVPIETFVDENRLLHVILQNIRFEAINCDVNWEPIPDGYNDHYDAAIDYYVESKQLGYELLKSYVEELRWKKENAHYIRDYAEYINNCGENRKEVDPYADEEWLLETNKKYAILEDCDIIPYVDEEEYEKWCLDNNWLNPEYNDDNIGQYVCGVSILDDDYANWVEKQLGLDKEGRWYYNGEGASYMSFK